MLRISIALEDVLLVARRQEDHWHVKTHLEQTHPQCITTDPHYTTQMYCGTFDQGVWRSTDAGSTWQQLDAGIEHDRVTALAVDPNLRTTNGYSTVYAGTEPSAVFRSDDGGDSWRRCTGLDELPSSAQWSFPPRPQTHHVRWIAPDPNADGTIYVAIEAGALVLSTDGGSTWEDRVPGGPYDTHTLATHPDAQSRLYVAAGDGYFESSDGGHTWHRPRNGLRHHYCWSIAVDPADPDTLIMSAAAGAHTAHNVKRAETYIYRKTAGRAWQQVRDGLPKPRGTSRSVLATDGETAGLFYAANNRGVFLSDDAGQTWAPLDISWPDEYRDKNVEALLVTPLGRT